MNQRISIHLDAETALVLLDLAATRRAKAQRATEHEVQQAAFRRFDRLDEATIALTHGLGKRVRQ